MVDTFWQSKKARRTGLVVGGSAPDNGGRRSGGIGHDGGGFRFPSRVIQLNPERYRRGKSKKKKKEQFGLESQVENIKAMSISKY